MLLAASSTTWVVLGVVWLLLLLFFGIRSIRRGHWIMFLIGIFIPIFWIIGALLPSTRE